MLIKGGEQAYLHYIIKRTREHNVDNISRTKAYQNIYLTYPEIKWSLLASVVSRNAGWNMTDLYLPPFQKLFHENERTRLFMTYERANWLIFSDAYPQLLIYILSIKRNKPLFYLLKEFNVSVFMIEEWYRFWTYQDQERLMTALIINEQNVIEAPVVKNNYFKQNVFHKVPYQMQNLLFMNAIIVPTKTLKLYGLFVHDFTNLTKRISLGKQIASVLFHKDTYHHILDFLIRVEYTGSRRDYEQFLDLPFPYSPILRMIYPEITHHNNIRSDWFKSRGLKKKWFRNIPKDSNFDITESFYNKRNMIFAYYHIKLI
ncbi:DUF2515 family protein [Virgibacillus byunsanensis]|uniref:DUF2515 family protein n=1 Tax=Virgibacillus byunsanensis TaxID=570945 RepID=A0ABW3LLE6_9BACI